MTDATWRLSFGVQTTTEQELQLQPAQFHALVRRHRARDRHRRLRRQRRHALVQLAWRVGLREDDLRHARFVAHDHELHALLVADRLHPAADRLLCGCEASERFYEIGTPATLAETDAFLRSRPRDKKSQKLVDTLRTHSDVLGQGTRYALAGGTVALVYLITTTVLATLVHLQFQLALAIGFCAGVVVHFTTP